MPRRARTTADQMQKTKTTIDPIRLLSQRELARTLGVSVHTVIAWRESGHLPRRRIIAGTKGYLYSDVVTALQAAPREDVGRKTVSTVTSGSLNAATLPS